MEELLTINKAVYQLIQDFESGNIAVPEIQRDVVWKPDDIKGLIDSISQDFPCGSLILWQPREKDKSYIRSIMRPERLEQIRRSHGELPHYFLIDGQQRVTALASIMLDRGKLRELLAEMEEELPFIFVNLKRDFPHDTVASTEAAGYKYPWVLFNDLFAAGKHIKGVSPEDTERLNQYAMKIRNYQFPIQIVKERKYVDVAEIFTRVNSAGTQLTGAEIHLAEIVPHWSGITRKFRDYRTQCMRMYYDIDLSFLMRAITAIECKVPRVKELVKRVRNKKLGHKRLDNHWKKAKSATDRLIRTLQRDLQLDKSKFFTSKNALVPLVYYLACDSGKRPAVRDVQRFFLLSQLSEHYGGAADTALSKDFRILAGRNTVRQGLSDLVEAVDHEARQSYRGLKIRPDHVYGVSSKNVLLLLMYVLMRRRGATDWDSGTGTTAKIKRLDEIGPEEMQLHHIFPFNFVHKNKAALKPYVDDGWTDAEIRAEINDITNLTFLHQETNASIGDKPPWQYLPSFTDREMRKAHFIPDDPDLWKPENFQKFLNERQELLAKGMTSLLKSIS